MNDLIIIKASNGLGRRTPSEDMICGLLVNGIAVTAGAQLGTGYRLKSVPDAVALGLDAEYDSANHLLVYEHISEFFRINPSGDLYIMLVAQTETFAEMCDKSEAGNAKKLLISAEGAIKRLGVAYNPTVAVTDFTATAAAILKAQELAEDEYVQHRPVSILLEGKGYSATANPLFDFRAQNSELVQVICGQALSVVNAHADFASYAALGTALGARSLAKVNEKFSWVEKFNVYGGSLTVSAIGGVALKTLSEGVLTSIDEKGAIFFRVHTGKAGLYFNNTHACTELTSDYAYSENSEVINKAVRLIREALLPKLDSPVLIDTETGKIPAQVVKSWESAGRRAVEEMLRGEEVSGIDVYMDPDQDILATNELAISFWVIPTGSASKINVTIGFTNPF